MSPGNEHEPAHSPKNTSAVALHTPISKKKEKKRKKKASKLVLAGQDVVVDLRAVEKRSKAKKKKMKNQSISSKGKTPIETVDSHVLGADETQTQAMGTIANRDISHDKVPHRSSGNVSAKAMKATAKIKKRKKQKPKRKHDMAEPDYEAIEGPGVTLAEQLQESTESQQPNLKKMQKNRESQTLDGFSDRKNPKQSDSEESKRKRKHRRASDNSESMPSIAETGKVHRVGVDSEADSRKETKEVRTGKRKAKKVEDDIQPVTREADASLPLESEDLTPIHPSETEIKSLDEHETPKTPKSEGTAAQGSKGQETDPRAERTLFVGNVSQTANQRDIKKLFKRFGKVETVRLRGIVPINPKIPKKAALLTNQLASFSDSFQAYVVFAETSDVREVMERACKELNMTVFMDRHIRVMPASHKTAGSRKQSLFIGNLPFDCSEEDIIRTFQEVATRIGVAVVGARVNRDADTGVGRGIGFVSFDDQLGVQGCINCQGEIKIGGRVIRMEPADKKKKLNTKVHKRHLKQTGAKSAQLYWQGASSKFMAGRSGNIKHRQHGRN